MAETENWLELDRIARTRRNNEVLRSLVPDSASVVLSKPERPKLPKFTSRMLLGAKRDQPPRTGKSSQVSSRDLPLRTPSKSGLWRCIESCPVTTTNVKALIKHLKQMHNLPFTTKNLAPLGLGLCAFCEGVFEGHRGIAVHDKSCKAKRRPLCSVIGGVFPRRCLAWWGKDKVWYEGVAALTDDTQCFHVVYPAELYGKESTHDELFHLVSFPPAVPTSPLLSLSSMLTPEGGVIGRSLPDSVSPVSVGSFTETPTSVPSLSVSFGSEASVLHACNFDDLADDLTAIPATVPEKRQPMSTGILIPSQSLCSSKAPTQVLYNSQSLCSKAPTQVLQNSLGTTQLYERTQSPTNAPTSGRMESLDEKHNLSQEPAPQIAPPGDTLAQPPALLCGGFGFSAPLTPVRGDRSPQLLSVLSPRPEFNFSEDSPLPFVSLEIKACASDDANNLGDLLPDWFREKSAFPVVFQSTKDCVTALLVKLHQNALFLRSLPALELWQWGLKKRWEQATQDFTPYFEQALHYRSDSTEFLKLCLRVLELPALALQRDMRDPAKVSDGKANLTGKLRRVETLTLQNRLNAASKVLFSHGIAQPTEALFDRLQRLHPALKEPIPEFKTQCEQFYITPRDVCKVLYKQCSERWDSLDPYGWNTSLLHLIRGAPRSPDSFFTLYCALISRLVDADVSDLTSFALTGGTIFGLNKDSEEVQELRLRNGQDPRERPINQGSLLLKLVFDLALHSPDAIGAAANLAPIQQGLGAKRGMEVIAHVCSTLYSEGFAILKLDATNGFQELKRSSLHQAVHRRCPSLLTLFQKYYTKESACFFDMEGEVRLLRADEGARIGCKLSSFGFALTAQDLYEDVRAIVSRDKDGSCIKTATDDVVVIIKADDEQALSVKVLKVWHAIEQGAGKIGLSFKNDKAQLLLPKDMVKSDRVCFPSGILLRSNTFADPALRGMEIVGTPVGSLDFCSRFVEKTIDKMLLDSESLMQLHPQCATKLLRECVCAAPGYIAQVCHPSVTREHLLRFDDSVWALLLRILGNDSGVACCEAVLGRARLRAFLPSRLDGAGLRSWDRTAAVAWYCSVASCLGLYDPDIEYARRFLAQKGKDAYEFALEALGGPSYLALSKVELLPIGEPEVLSDSDFYPNMFRDDPKLKLQHKFQEVLGVRARKEFLEYNLVHTDASQKVLLQSLEHADPGSSLLLNLFTAHLTQRDTRLTKTEFVVAARQFLCLPQLKNPQSVLSEAKCGCEIQVCENSKCTKNGEPLDAAGNHALVCHPGVKAQKATLIERALEKSFRHAGGVPTRQPSTYSLLGGIFTKEDLSRLFPGQLSAKRAEERRKLAMKYLDILRDTPRGSMRAAQIGMLRDFEFPTRNITDEEINGTIRFDLRFPLQKPLDRPRELWFDHAIVQETCPTYAHDVLKFFEGKDSRTQDSPAFIKMKGSKTRRYAALQSIVDRLREDRKLAFQPEFLFPVVSSLGFMNEDMEKLVKFMVQHFKNNQPATPRFDGLTIGALQGRYNKELKNSICFALLKGNALAMSNQGLNGLACPA